MNLNIAILLILLGGWISGRLFKLIKLPSILGMVLFGIGLSVIARQYYPQILLDLAPFLKSLALIIILLRAGLGISKSTLKKIGFRALLISIIPCLCEALCLFLICHLYLGFSLPISGLIAFMLSAVSPAVIVPSMLELKAKGLGEKKEIPTLILTGASVDDVIAITLFSLFLSLAIAPSPLLTAEMTQGATPFFESTAWTITTIPLSLIGGILAGVILGFALVGFFKWRGQKINSTESTLILLTLAIMLVQIGESLHIAALLGVMTAGFILLEKSHKEAKELSGKLSQIWIFAEIILFVLIGMAVDVPTALEAGWDGLLLIAAGLTARSIGVLLSLTGSIFNKRERLFCVIAFWPKATVQAALGSVALERGLPEGNTILSFAVLAIIVTAPLGLLGINLAGKRLLAPDKTV